MFVTKKVTRTVSKPTECSAIITIPEQNQEDQLAIEYPGQANNNEFDLFPNDDIPDDFLVNTPTQIEIKKHRIYALRQGHSFKGICIKNCQLFYYPKHQESFSIYIFSKLKSRI